MIRRSTSIAIVALLLSLLLHLAGLNTTFHVQPKQGNEEVTEDVITISNAFEDLVEPLPEPPPQEVSAPPEPDYANAPEPESADAPISEALVASETPQQTFSPDTGTEPVATSEAAGSNEGEPGQIAEPQPTAPTGGQLESPAEQEHAAPIAPEQTTAAPVPSAPQPSPALSAPATASLPVTPAPALSTVPIVPLQEEPLPPESPEPLDPPKSERVAPEQAEEVIEPSDLAVTTSLRPQLAPRQPQVESTDKSETATALSDLLSPPLIESPLSAYQRDQSNPFAGQNGGSLSGDIGFLQSRNTGNSSTTNYAGRVLVHLNRAPSVRVSIPGTVRVLFEINPDGSLARVDVTSNTGTQELARAAKTQIRSAAPFPPPPKGARRRMSFVYRSN
ncbi:MAG: hypothetical protein BM558_08735 [Roseobacter sp. MedPE-SW]|nr:MAG: hypothetical protein BM558_08735 [Roseobacter sp. MedPE-SW]